MSTTLTPPADVLRRAHLAVAVVFAMNGLAFASIISRTPAVRDALELDSAQLGLLLLCISAGSITGLPLSGPLVHKLGSARAVLAAALVAAVGLALVSVGLLLPAVAVAAPGLYLVGLGVGTWDVAMNVEGAEVERALGRPIMPRLHAAFSVGTVAGAGVGTAFAALAVPLAWQILGAVVVVPLIVGLGVRHFLGRVGASAEESAKGSGVLAAWRDPRTLAIGLLTLAFAFTEGSANDWIAIAMVDGYGAGEAIGAAAFGLFVVAMTIGRLSGGWALQRFGRVATLRATAVLALAGLLLVLLGGSAPVALAGALLWGLGASLGFPVGMSAASDDPATAAARVSVVSSIGYTAFLAGPPLIGLLAEHVGILRALFVVLAALGLGLLAAGSTRPRGAAAGAGASPTGSTPG